ncbi:hypothetical protein YTPLAS18_17960 [Nitrospira sp.]|nr:hypothetical protein YTPLAS18_17960 [Nitrospira sp.]
MMAATSTLTAADLRTLEGTWIDSGTAEAFALYRVNSADGATLVGRSDRADYSGLVFPTYWPGSATPREYYLRRDHPELEQCNGHLKERQKYVGPPGRGNRLLFGPGEAVSVLADPSRPIVLVEGLKKLCAAWRLARWESDPPRFVACGITGVWNWRGTIGKTTNANGARVDIKGPIPDLDRVTWKDCPVLLLFDSDAATNPKIRAARDAFAEELRSRGARVMVMYLPSLDGLEKTGFDDLCAQWGPERVLDWLQRAEHGAHAAQTDEEMQVTETHGLYIVTFPSCGAVFQFDRLTDARGGVTAELTVRRGTTELLGETDLGLKSGGGRDKIARMLEEMADGVPWKRMLERACTSVFKYHRVGEPVIILEPTATPHVPFIVNPFIHRGHPSLFYAPGGSLKSYFALYLALLASHGIEQHGIAALACPVLYLDWELNAETVGGRLNALQAGHPELREYVPYYRRCERPLHQEVAPIARHVAEHRVELLILDSAAMACGGDLNKPETVVQLTRALRTIGCSSLLLAHISKATPEGAERTAYGSVYFRELSRNVWELERAATEGPARVIATHVKHNFSEQHRPLAFEFQFDGDAVRVLSCDPQEEPAFEPKLPLVNRIRNLLEDGTPRTAQQIAEEIEAKAGSVKATLSKYNGIKWSKLGDNRDAQWTVVNR